MLPLVQWNSYNKRLVTFKARFSGAPPDARPSGWEDCLGAQDFHSCGRTSVVQLFSSLQVAHPVGKGLAEQYIRKKKILQNQSLELGWFSGAK